MKYSSSGKFSIASNVLIMAMVGAVWHGVRIPMPFSYTAHKMLHIFGVILFVGNITVGPLWLIVALRRNDPAVLKYAMRTLVLADVVFTTPGVQLTLWNGLAMASVFGGVHAQPWLWQSLILLVPLSLVSPTIVLYYQERLAHEIETDADRTAIRRSLIQWSAWGTVIFIPIGLVFYLMVSKARAW